jgi:hypothetical protein
MVITAGDVLITGLLLPMGSLYFNSAQVNPRPLYSVNNNMVGVNSSGGIFDALAELSSSNDDLHIQAAIREVLPDLHAYKCRYSRLIDPLRSALRHRKVLTSSLNARHRLRHLVQLIDEIEASLANCRFSQDLYSKILVALELSEDIEDRQTIQDRLAKLNGMMREICRGLFRKWYPIH